MRVAMRPHRLRRIRAQAEIRARFPGAEQRKPSGAICRVKATRRSLIYGPFEDPGRARDTPPLLAEAWQGQSSRASGRKDELVVTDRNRRWSIRELESDAVRRWLAHVAMGCKSPGSCCRVPPPDHPAG